MYTQSKSNKKVQELIGKGLSYAQISEKTGLTKANIYYHRSQLVKNGLLEASEISKKLKATREKNKKELSKKDDIIQKNSSSVLNIKYQNVTISIQKSMMNKVLIGPDTIEVF